MSDRPPIRIGALVPLTPPGWVDAGQHLLAGIELAVHDANDGGGIAGRSVELLVRETAADPQRAAAAVDDLVMLGVVALAGEYHSVVACAVAARAEAHGVPFLCSSAVLDALTDAPAKWVARLAPPQTRGWRIFADFLVGQGHTHVALVIQPSIYWAAGARILRERFAATGGVVTEVTIGAATPRSVCDALESCGATALLLLVGIPEPAVSIVKAVRSDPRLAAILIGAPAGQPEFDDWATQLGERGAAIPFLRYMPERDSPIGARVRAVLVEQLGKTPSFVAFEGYDTITALVEMLRSRAAGHVDAGEWWACINVEGTRGQIRFSSIPGVSVAQWAQAPIQVVDRDPAMLDSFRILCANYSQDPQTE